jgi:hypothetical protein
LIFSTVFHTVTAEISKSQEAKSVNTVKLLVLSLSIGVFSGSFGSYLVSLQSDPAPGLAIAGTCRVFNSGCSGGTLDGRPYIDQKRGIRAKPLWV